MGYSFRLAARVILYASSHRQDSTCQGLCYTSHGALAGTRSSSMGPPWRIDPTTHRTMSERSYHGATSRSLSWTVSLSLVKVITDPVQRVHRDESVLYRIVGFRGARTCGTVWHDLYTICTNCLYNNNIPIMSYSDSERENPLAPHRLHFPISSNGSFICIIP